MKTTYISYRIAQIFAQILPRRFAYWIGLRIADRFYTANHKGRRAVISNLRHIFKAQGKDLSDETLKEMARKNFQYFGKYVVDFFHFTHLTLAESKRLVQIEHIEYLQQAESLDKGVIMISAHIGSSPAAVATVKALGKRLNVVIQEEQTSKINKLMQKYRSKRGMNIIPMGHAAPGVLKALRRKEIAILLADWDFTPHNEPMLFFGAPARLPSGPARVAVKTGAPILPVFLLRKDDDTFLFRFHPPILPQKNSSIDDIRCRIRDVLQAEIGENPLQWFMFTDFWNPGNAL